MTHRFQLPPAIADLVAARNRLREHYKSAGLQFTLDGNLVGDLAESIAVELFDLRLVDTRSHAGIDGIAADGRTVQVKATGIRGGPAFRKTETRADHLLFFSLDFEGCAGLVVFNGPEELVTRHLPQTWVGQKTVTWTKVLAADAEVRAEDRLKARPISGT
jgi:hypothetical protein